MTSEQRPEEREGIGMQIAGRKKVPVERTEL